jgi:hypothetical protein
MEQGRKISQNFTGHAWSQETGGIIVCTDEGEMVMCENSGQYKAYILDSPVGNTIQQVTALSSGFLVAVGNSFYIYRTSHIDDRAPLKCLGYSNLQIVGEPAHLSSSNTV